MESLGGKYLAQHHQNCCLKLFARSGNSTSASKPKVFKFEGSVFLHDNLIRVTALMERNEIFVVK